MCEKRKYEVSWWKGGLGWWDALFGWWRMYAVCFLYADLKVVCMIKNNFLLSYWFAGLKSVNQGQADPLLICESVAA